MNGGAPDSSAHFTTPRSPRPVWPVEIHSPAREYLVALLAIALATGVGFLIRPWSHYWAVAVVYLFTIMLLSLRVGQGPVFFAATVGALTWDFLFFPPIFSFVLERLEDWLMFGLFFALALSTGRLTGRIRAQERAERERAQRATALYELTRTLASAHSADEVLRRAVGQVRDLFGARVALLLAPPDAPASLVPHPASSYALTATEQAAAAAQSPAPGSTFFPLAAAGRVFGVMAVRLERDAPPSPAQAAVLEAFSTQIALALAHEQLRAAHESARVQAASDRLHRTLLDSVSHELKTPLAVIASAAETLHASVPPPDRPLVREIHLASDRLRRLVGNLLDTTRLESGGLHAQLDWCDLTDLVNAALKATADFRRGRTVHVHLPAGLPLVRCDFDLIQQALVNLLHNAAHHTPPTAEITVSAGCDESAGRVWLAVTDTGPGLDDEQRARVFERFYRGQPKRTGGLGLGLSIAREFVRAHAGDLVAEPAPGGGARFVLTLPLELHDLVPAE